MKISFLSLLALATMPLDAADRQPFATTPLQLGLRPAAAPPARGTDFRRDAVWEPGRVEYGQPIPPGNGGIFGVRLDAPGPGYRAMCDKYRHGITVRSLDR